MIVVSRRLLTPWARLLRKSWRKRRWRRRRSRWRERRLARWRLTRRRRRRLTRRRAQWRRARFWCARFWRIRWWWQRVWRSRPRCSGRGRRERWRGMIWRRSRTLGMNREPVTTVHVSVDSVLQRKNFSIAVQPNYPRRSIVAEHAIGVECHQIRRCFVVAVCRDRAGVLRVLVDDAHRIQTRDDKRVLDTRTHGKRSVHLVELIRLVSAARRYADNH